MDQSCAQCGGRCCKYFCFQIDAPTDYDEYEDVRWFLMHEGVTVHIDEGDWYIAIANRCKNLQEDNRCGVYETRPNICRSYETDNCDFTGGDYGYDQLFETAEQLETYARLKLGDVKFNRARAKAWKPKLPKAAKLKAPKSKTSKAKRKGA